MVAHTEWMLALAGWLGILSVVTVVLSVLLLPRLLVRLPVDHLCAPTAARPRPHGARARLWFLLRNLLALLLLVAGVLMLFLPGQGILTIVAGLWLGDLPGKHALERHLLGRPHVLAAVNWIRARAKVPPLRPADCTPR